MRHSIMMPLALQNFICNFQTFTQQHALRRSTHAIFCLAFLAFYAPAAVSFGCAISNIAHSCDRDSRCSLCASQCCWRARAVYAAFVCVYVCCTTFTELCALFCAVNEYGYVYASISATGGQTENLDVFHTLACRTRRRRRRQLASSLGARTRKETLAHKTRSALSTHDLSVRHRVADCSLSLCL